MMQSIEINSNNSMSNNTSSSQSSHLVNLAATFNDHLTCTKLICKNDFSRSQLRVLGYGSFIDQLYSTSSSSTSSSSQTEKQNKPVVVSPHSDNNFDHFDQLKLEIKSLKNIILAHLDLIQNQQEQLLKKDRQLQNLRHDRQLLITRIHRMQQDLDQYRTNQVTLNTGHVLINSESPQTNNYCASAQSSLTVERLPLGFSLPNTTSLAASQSSQTFSCESTSQVCTKCSPFIVKPQKKTTSVSGLSRSQLSLNANDNGMSVTRLDTCFDAFSIKPNEKKIFGELEIKSIQVKKTFTPKQSTSKSKQQPQTTTTTTTTTSDAISVLEEAKSPKKRKLSRVTKEPEESESTRIDKRDPDGETESTVTGTSVEPENKIRQNLISMETDVPYNLITNPKRNSELEEEATIVTKNNNSGNVNESRTSQKESEIEIPSWRLHPITSCYSLEGTENLNDEVFNRRHAKFEIDEKRRKRWDLQRIREQKMNERLRSGRYAKTLATAQSNQTNNHSLNLYEAPGNESSFYPEPSDAQYIQVSDTLPVVAFGHPIPKLPETYFSLPWRRSFSKDTLAKK